MQLEAATVALHLFFKALMTIFYLQNTTKDSSTYYTHLFMHLFDGGGGDFVFLSIVCIVVLYYSELASSSVCVHAEKTELSRDQSH